MTSPDPPTDNGPGPPGPAPEPPRDLPARTLPIREFDQPVWFRGHKAHHGPIHFNRATGRSASPHGEFGTLYLGQDEFSSFIEAFSQEVIGHGPFGPIVSRARLARCCLCRVTATRTTQLVDLTNGPALRRLSPDADNRINGGPHTVSQRWALAFWSHPSQPDGLLYRSRRAPEKLAVALFDRVAPDLTADDENLLNDADRMAAILDYFGCALVP
jgi:hypothetical protein